MRKRGDTKVLKPLAYLFVDEKRPLQLRLSLALSTKVPSPFLLSMVGLSGTTTEVQFRCTDFS